MGRRVIERPSEHILTAQPCVGSRFSAIRPISSYIDTTLYVRGHSLEKIGINLQTALDYLAKWCGCNGMLINTTKTKLC